MLKTIHMWSAGLSIGGYVLRGIWMLMDSPLLQARLTRTLPHIIDTILLAAGIALALQIHQYPFVQSWLTAKVLALIAYIVVGAVGLRYGRTKRVRTIAWVAAILIFAYIVRVAITHSPTLGFA